MRFKAVYSTILISMTAITSQAQDMRKLSDLSHREGWVFLAYAGISNKIFYVHDGRVELIYPQTDVVKELGPNVISELGHEASPSLSPNGAQIAFVRRFSAVKPRRGNKCV